MAAFSNMNRTASICAAALAVTFATASCGEKGAADLAPAKAATPAAAGPGRIAFDETRHDYGTMDQGRESVHVFTIRNKGAGPLKLLGVTTTCGCAAMVLDKNELPPGGTARLEVKFRSGSFVGVVEKYVIVQSDDPRQPRTPLGIRAKVLPVYIMDPPALHLGELPRGQGAVREVMLRDSKGLPFGITSVTVSNEDVKAEVFPNDGGRHPAYRIRVTLSAKRNVGPFNLLVIPQTDRPEFPRPIILVSGAITGPVQVRPTAVFLGKVMPGQVFKPATVTVNNTGPGPVTIELVDTGDERIVATVKTNAPGREFEIELRAGAMPVGWFQRMLRIRASDSETPLEVPVNGVVLKAPEGAAP
jgi:predicted small lipoprotein YifL